MSLEPEDDRHGTYAGYQAGCRAECCRTALRDYMRDYRANNPRAYGRERLRSNARQRALWRLAELHPDEFQSLYLDEIGPAKRVVANG